MDASGKAISPFPTSIPRDDGIAIYNLVRNLKPKKTLEIGMAYGLSTLFICQALFDNGKGSHSAIDPEQNSRWGSIGMKNLHDCGLEKLCRLYEEDSSYALPRLCAQNERFDFIFIDGIHHFDHALLDFFYSDRLLAGNGYIMLHDTWMPAIRKLRKFILTNRNYAVVPEGKWNKTAFSERLLRACRRLQLNSLHGWKPNYSLLRKPENTEKDWDYFRDF